jgi:hypothetical protein
MFKLSSLMAFFLGPRLYFGGGDSGGGSQTGTQTQITELPEWARGYAKSALEKGAALSDKPYQAYGGDRIAGFSPMQLGAQQQAAGMQTSAATGQGINLAGQIAGQAMGTAYNPYQTGQFGAQASKYMDPYMQNVVDIQQREAQRQADIARTQSNATAVKSGAFGGSRQAIVDAEAARNLATQKGDIQARGLQDAYSRGQNQFNVEQQLGEQSRQYGAGLGMQGLQTALTGAGQLGQLGNQQFVQGMDINKLQNAYGGQQQALRQQGLTQAYQDFQNEQNYPYKQLGFFSDMIRGMPVGQSSTRTMYEPDPSMAQQIGALGMGAYGLSKFMAEGGMAYADGGSVDSPDNIQRIVSRLSDQQLQQSAQAAQARGDMDQLEAIQSEMAMRASERNGLASSVTPDMADRMAGGGVVAFAGGGLSDYMKNIVDASEKFKPATVEDRLAGVKKALPGIQSLYGESALKPFIEDLKKDRAELATQKRQGEGLAFLMGAKGLLRPGSKSRAMTEAFSEIGTGLAKANKDYSDANSKLRQSEMTLAAAEQARSDGQIGKAESLYDKGRTEEKDAIKDKISANKDLATIQASVDNNIRSVDAQREATAASAAASKRSHEASMAQLNKPGENERMLAELDAIYSGKKSYRGLTGEKGAEAYQNALGSLGASRYGVKYTGPNKDFEHKKAVLDVLQKDEGVKIAQMNIAKYEAKPKLLPQEQAILDANKAFVKKRYNEVSSELQKSGGPTGGAAAQSTGPTLQQFLAAARAAPENKNFSDEQLAAYYHRTYGGK